MSAIVHLQQQVQTEAQVAASPPVAQPPPIKQWLQLWTEPPVLQLVQTIGGASPLLMVIFLAEVTLDLSKDEPVTGPKNKTQHRPSSVA